MDAKPILYSFRRCPYAIRARLAIYSAGIQVELREILLREKAPKFLKTSESKTCLLYTSPSPRDVEESRMPSSA